MTRPYHYWTDEEREILRKSIGLPLRAIQRRLGRPVTVGAVKYQCYQITGRWIGAAVETQGLSVDALTQALDVSRESVRRWYRLADDDRLPTFIAHAARRERHLIKPIDLIAWIKRGTLIKWDYVLGGDWKPAPQWRGFVADAEHEWRAEYVNNLDLRQIFSVARQMPRTFPQPDIQASGGERSNWWRRDAVRAWLDAHDRHWTSNAREVL